MKGCFYPIRKKILCASGKVSRLLPLFLFLISLFAFSQVNAKTVVIGSGSGAVSQTSMTGLSSGDILAIAPGTYSSGDFENLTGITIINNGGLVTFTGTLALKSTVDVHFAGTGLAGLTYGFYFKGITGVTIYVQGYNRGLRMYNCEFRGCASGTNYMVDATSNNTYSDTSHMNLYRTAFVNWHVASCGQIFQGNYAAASALQGVVDSIAFQSFIVDTCVGNGTGIQGNGIYRMDVNNWTVSGGTPNHGEDVGMLGVIAGNGRFHNIKRSGMWGWLIRISNCGLNGYANSYVYNNINVNTSSYGLVDTRVASAQLSGDTTKKPFVSGGSMYVLNNTAGNMTDGVGYVAPIALDYGMTPYRLIVKNNLGYNSTYGANVSNAIVNNISPTNSVTLGSSADNLSGDTSNNRYYTSSTILNVLADISPANCFLKSGSALIDAGVTVPVATSDIAGVARPQGSAYDIGAREYNSGQTVNQLTVDIGTAQTITLPTNSISLTGTTTDLLSTISTFAWTELSGPNTATMSTTSKASTTMSGLVAGVYVFQLKVVDLLGLSATATATITVNPAPTPPVVSAGADQTITMPVNTVTLTGTASDASGTITSYAWTQLSGPNTATISSPAALKSAVKAMVAGSYIFQIKVTDSYGLSTTSTVTITVNPAVNQAPVANAGANQTITLPVNTVTLNGTGSSDPDGTIASYKWTKLSGPTSGTITSSTASTTTVNTLAQGTYSFKLVVTDNSGATDADTVTVTVNAAVNQSPVANAGSSKTVTLPVNSASLDGTGSSDPDGTIAGYVWSQVSGPSTATIANATSSTPGVSALVAGTYTFQLTVTDNSGATATAQVKVIVNPAANQSPVANAGTNQNITLPVNTVTLDGTGSSDPDGTIASYKWTKLSGPTSGTIANSTGSTTAVNTLVQGTYSYKLVVTDNNGATDADTVTITVNAAANQLPVANAGSSKTVTLPVNSASLDGTGSSDPDGTIAGYAWSQVSGPSTATITNATSSTPNVSGLVAGTYTFKLTVTDNSGATATAQVKVIVNPAANQSPVADAGTNQNITLPVNTVTLDGTGSSDPDGTIAGYKWTKISGPASGTIVNSTGSTTAVNTLVQGTYSYKLVVTDNSGATDADTVTITVNAAANQLPVANAGSSKTITLPVNSASLDGTGSSDPDGTIAGYAWSQVSGPSTATIANATSSTPGVSALVAGTYTFKLTVTDNSGATATAQVKVIVNPAANQSPVANAGINQTITLPVNTVTLDGSGSVDPDGTIAGYKWTKISGPTSGTIVNSTGSTTAVNTLVQGTYSYKLVVTDNNGATDADTITITVNAAVNQLPVANAGSSKTITLPVNSASLDGTGSSDPDGTIAGYAWSQVSGPSTASITNATTSTPDVSGLIEGKYTFKLTVTDNDGATATANVNVTVNATANVNPVANAGSDQTIVLPVSGVTLDGSASEDPNGTITGYSWTKLSGPAAGNIISAGNANTAVTGLVQGVYFIVLTVTDNDGNTATDTVTITVNAAANQLPTANAGSRVTITLPVNSVSLNGSLSSDPDGTIAGYAWNEVTGPSTATITNANTATPSVSGLVAGNYTFQLTVTDNSGATATANVRVTVRAAANQPPVANTGANQTITLPVNTVTLDGSASQDPDGTITNYGWTEISGPTQAPIVSAGNAITVVNTLVEGTYVFALTVTDNNGATNTDSVAITVNAIVNLDPVANAGSTRTITLPVNSVSLDGTRSSDPDGTIAGYSWTQFAGPSTATISNANTSIPTVSGLQVGNYYFILTVTDNDGATANATVRVTVRPAVNQAPVANTGGDQSITLPVSSVTLDGSASLDPDGTIANYSWTEISGPTTATIVSAGNATTVVNTLVQGTYIFKLTVTDNSGATNSDSVTITVNAAVNRAPVANAGSTRTITLPVNSVSLDGTRSADADGTIVSYNWVQLFGPSTATITNANTAAPTVSGLQAGNYYFTLTVTDNNGATATATVRVTVRAAVNQAPVSNAGANRTITLPVNSLTLDGSASQDPDGTIADYSWTEKSGPSQAGIVSAGNVTTVVNALVQGTYIFNLTVTDNSGATNTDSVIVIVNPAVNQAPIANAGSSRTITLPVSSASLDGSQSADADGIIASYKWIELSGPSTAVITNGNAVTPLVSGLVVGQYVFQLTVTDNNGATGTAQVKVIVKAPVNQSPVANAGADKTIQLPINSVTLDGSGSHDPDGTIVSYSWNKISGTGALTIVNSNTAAPTAVGLQEGQYVFQLTVTDNTGATATDNVTVTVLAAAPVGDQSPIANAGADQALVLPTNSTSLDGSKSSDPDGSISAYTWTVVSGSGVGISNANTVKPTISSLTEGTYIFKLTVTDNKGASSSDEVTVTVAAAVAPVDAPVANAGIDTTIAIPANSVVLNGSGSTDANGTITSYQWIQVSGPANATIETSNAAVVNVTDLLLGEYNFQLTVSNNRGGSSKATVKVKVIDNLRSLESILLYPNPAQSVINLRLNTDSTGRMRVDIYDMTGKMVQGAEMDKPQSFFDKSMNISGLAHGMYIMQVTIGTNKKMISKFIKQ